MAPLSTKNIAALWVRLTEIFGYRFVNAYGDDPASSTATTWARGLAGLTRHQLAQGLHACVASADAWPPTLPEFRARCVGIPSLARVQIELRGRSPRSPFTHAVWQLVDAFAYSQASSWDAERMLRGAYEVVREEVIDGRVLDPVPVGEIGREVKPAPVVSSGEVKAAYIRDIEALFEDPAPAEEPANG